MFSISAVVFLMAVYIWLNESQKGRSLKVLASGWFALFALFVFIGVALGYNLHTKGFMAILIITTVFGSGHIFIRLWQKLLR